VDIMRGRYFCRCSAITLGCNMRLMIPVGQLMSLKVRDKRSRQQSQFPITRIAGMNLERLGSPVTQLNKVSLQVAR
jgi:hypothetical protein